VRARSRSSLALFGGVFATAQGSVGLDSKGLHGSDNEFDIGARASGGFSVTRTVFEWHTWAWLQKHWGL